MQNPKSDETASLPLGKHLASSDKKTRDKAIKGLASFLSDESRQTLPEDEIAKLWKGIFYCFWMSDKPLVQQALAADIANIVLLIPSTNSALAFLRGFWVALVREWSGIDRLRLDKYYMLSRTFVNVAFRLLLREEWKQAVCDEYLNILGGSHAPLCPDDDRVPSSLAYHLADVYVEELDKVLAELDDASEYPVPILTLLTPFITLVARTPSKITYGRLQSSLFDPLLASLKPVSDPNAGSDDPKEPSRKRPRIRSPDFPNLLNTMSIDGTKLATLSEARKAILRKLFEVASQEESRDSNRRKIYALWRDSIADDETEDE